MFVYRSCNAGGKLVPPIRHANDERQSTPAAEQRQAQQQQQQQQNATTTAAATTALSNKVHVPNQRYSEFRTSFQFLYVSVL